MGPDPQHKLPPSLPSQRIRTIAGLLVPALVFGSLFVLAPESTSRVAGVSDGVTTRPDEKTVSGPPSDPFVVSYTEAASYLTDLPEQEKQEQLRDWLLPALAAHLKLDIGNFRNAVHDAAPVRDEGLADITRQPTGPGRALFDGQGLLHLLVPSDDRNTSRTIGLLLDQHRTDHGSDPRWVRIHRYTIDPRAQEILVDPGEQQNPERLRAAHGYVTMLVDEPDGLQEFLDKTRHLSRLERRGAEIWAAGWKWPTGSAPPITMADVTVIQRGYKGASKEIPGFSLDPPKHTDALPKLPEEEKYHQARYDGGLKGTEVGMTLFYTDLMAKFWVSGTGTGVPGKAVQGFVSDPDAKVPAAHCPAEGEKPTEDGRLWFGQNESGFRFDDDRVEIGAHATRLFLRTSAKKGEIESSYSFGRGPRWWDRHFQEVADYEPQYARLEQIMRWSGALEWLGFQAHPAGLPKISDGEVQDDLRFQNWYQRRTELRERGKIQFVRPLPGQAETLVSKPSKPFGYCGWHLTRGGVALADTLHRLRNETWRPGPVPEGARRAGLFDPASWMNPVDGTGRIRQVWLNNERKVTHHLERKFSTGENGSLIVETIGEQPRSGSFFDLKVWRSEGARRSLRIELKAKNEIITESIELEGHRWGRLQTVAGKGRVLLRWIPGPLERVRLALQSAQDGSTPARESGLYRYRGADKVGGPGDHWLWTTKDIAAPSDDLAFRLGTPQPGGMPEFSLGTLRPARPGEGPGGPRGPPGDWLEFSIGQSHGPLVAVPSPPSSTARKMRVETVNGRSGEVRLDNEHAWVRADDPVMGLDSTESAAAALRDFDRVTKAWNEAKQADDGLYRSVALGPDGVALVGGDRTIIAPPDHPFAARVREALGQDPVRSMPLIGIESGQPAHYGHTLSVLAEQREHVEWKETGLDSHDNVLVSEQMWPSMLHDGPLTVNGLPHDRKIIVMSAKVEIDPNIESTRVLADSYQQQRGTQQLTWFRITGPGGRPGGPVPYQGLAPIPARPSPSPSLTPSAPDGPSGDGVRVQVWLVCLDEETPDPACVP